MISNLKRERERERERKREREREREKERERERERDIVLGETIGKPHNVQIGLAHVEDTSIRVEAKCG